MSRSEMNKLHVSFEPSLLARGRAPNGKIYDMRGLGVWSKETGIALPFESSTLTRRQIRSYWQWAGRSDRMPKQLVIELKVNPEHFRWILIRDAFKFVESKLKLNKQEIEKSLILAFRNRHIRTTCSHYSEKPSEDGKTISVTAHDIEAHSKDVLRWLKLEHDVDAKLSELFAATKDGMELFFATWPSLDDDWPELDGDGGRQLMA
jgi:hypothetical protein